MLAAVIVYVEDRMFHKGQTPTLLKSWVRLFLDQDQVARALLMKIEAKKEKEKILETKTPL